MSPTARAAEHRRARPKRPRHRPVPAVADHQRRLRHHLRVGEPVDHHRVRRRLRQRPADSAGSSSPPPAPAPPPAPRAPPAPAAAPGSCAVLGATSTSGSSPSGSSMSGYGSSNSIGPVTCTAGRPAPRILELRERRHQRQLAADPAVELGHRRAAPRPPASRSSPAGRAAARSSAPAATPATSRSPTGVRGGCAPNAKNGIPGSCTG